MRWIKTLKIGLFLAATGFAGPALAEDGVVQATLPNGLRVVIVRDALAPMVATRLVYLAGSTVASADFPGTAHALEHMMFRGTSTLNNDQLSRIFQATGSRANAFTAYEQTQYVFDIAPVDLGVMLHIEADRMQNLALDPAQWARERGAIEQEVSRDRSSSVMRAREQFDEALFEGTPFAWSALGTRQSFDATTPERLRQFYQAWYAPNNAILFVVGDVQPKATLKLVQQAFGTIPSRPLPARPTVPLAQPAARTLTAPTDAAVGRITIGWRVPGLHQSDAPALAILADAISNSRSKLGVLGLDGKSLGTSFFYAGTANNAALTASISFPRGQDPASYQANLNAVLAEYRAHGIPADLVEAAKRARLKGAEFERNSIAGLTHAWTMAVAEWGVSSPDALTKAYASVTPEQVNALAARYLDPDHAITQISLPQGNIPPTQDKGFGGAESFGDKPVGAVPLPDWAQSVLTMPPAPQWPLPRSVSTLPNGLRLIVRPYHASHTIQVFGMVRINPALEEPAGKDGVASLTSQLLLYGTPEHDRLSIVKRSDDIGSSVWIGSTFGAAAQTQDFPATLALLADTQLNPAFREADLATVREKLAVARQGLLQTPNHMFQRAALERLLPPNDPQLRQATPQTIRSVNRDDVTAFFQKAYRPDMTVIEVIGDIEPDAAKTAVMAAFGNWHASGPKPDVVFSPLPDIPTVSLQMEGEGRTQDMVEFLQPVGLRLGQPDTMVFSLGNQILSLGFPSRFYQALRVKTGYVYGVRSATSVDETRGTFQVSFGADPAKVPLAETLTRSLLKDMQTTPVSTAELARVKGGYLRTQPFGTASLNSIANRDLFLISHDLPLDQPNRDISTVAAATPEQIRAVFEREVHPDALSTFIYGPKPPEPAPAIAAGQTTPHGQ
ncbi:M16 family metallopeptidase [Acetobacter senegalensis]|uniref:M16 family metallopeptidase n=1 Tax=Acetobacter senegalensis TaxID=446692 RepID=UPI001EDD53E6|nr:pitrilysin family protein [Acetobacter senegalensis]MCG4274650.1 insulinase family protein [Acetobacter senegalensis]